MAYGRSNAHGSWFHEQQSLVNSVTKEELSSLQDKFDQRFEDVVGQIQSEYAINIMTDAKRMMESPAVMAEYKELMLQPILEEFRSYPTTSDSERAHMEQVADQLEAAWDSSTKTFLIQESYNVANYLPLLITTVLSFAIQLTIMIIAAAETKAYEEEIEAVIKFSAGGWIFIVFSAINIAYLCFAAFKANKERKLGV